MGKLTRSRVLRGVVGIRGAPKSGDRARKIFLSCGAERELGKTKPCPIAIPRLWFRPKTNLR